MAAYLDGNHERKMPRSWCASCMLRLDRMRLQVVVIVQASDHQWEIIVTAPSTSTGSDPTSDIGNRFGLDDCFCQDFIMPLPPTLTKCPLRLRQVLGDVRSEGAQQAQCYPDGGRCRWRFRRKNSADDGGFHAPCILPTMRITA